MDEILLVKSSGSPRKGWKEQFEQAGLNCALSDEEKEWVEASLDHEEGWIFFTQPPASIRIDAGG